MVGRISRLEPAPLLTPAASHTGSHRSRTDGSEDSRTSVLPGKHGNRGHTAPRSAGPDVQGLVHTYGTGVLGTPLTEGSCLVAITSGYMVARCLAGTQGRWGAALGSSTCCPSQGSPMMMSQGDPGRGRRGVRVEKQLPQVQPRQTLQTSSDEGQACPCTTFTEGQPSPSRAPEHPGSSPVQRSW